LELADHDVLLAVPLMPRRRADISCAMVAIARHPSTVV
jgi:hypothetical protein